MTAVGTLCVQTRVHVHTQYFVAQTGKDKNLNSITCPPHHPPIHPGELRCRGFELHKPRRLPSSSTRHVFQLVENDLPVEGSVCVFHVELPSCQQWRSLTQASWGTPGSHWAACVSAAVFGFASLTVAYLYLPLCAAVAFPCSTFQHKTLGIFTYTSFQMSDKSKILYIRILQLDHHSTSSSWCIFRPCFIFCSVWRFYAT